MSKTEAREPDASDLVEVMDELAAMGWTVVVVLVITVFFTLPVGLNRVYHPAKKSRGNGEPTDDREDAVS